MSQTKTQLREKTSQKHKKSKTTEDSATNSNSATEMKEKSDISSSEKEKTVQNVEGKKYSRGENQKPVTKAYRENWNSIFKNEQK